MKTLSIFFVGILLLLVSGNVKSAATADKNNGSTNNSVSVMCTPDLFNLTTRWANEYNNLNPETKIDVIKTTYNSADLNSGEYVSFISNKAVAVAGNEKNWKMVVGREVIVPVMNSANPFAKEIQTKGITCNELSQILANPAKRNWGTALANRKTESVHIYMVNDEAVKTGIAKFMAESQVQYTGITLATSEEVVTAIQHDPLALGFCNFADIQGSDNQNVAANIQLLPIDKNGNGSLDQTENIYSDLNTFQRGVWIGKYPKALVSNIYAVSNTQPVQENEVAFVKWVLTDGQQFMNANGYCDLVNSESQSQLDKLSVATINVSTVDKTSKSGTAMLILIILVVVGLITGALVRSYKKQNNITPEFNVKPVVFNEDSIAAPNGLYFDKTHTWAFMEKDGNVTVGMDDFLQHITGPITHVEMKNPSEKIKKGDLLFCINQSGKQLSMYAPVSGTIVKQNEMLRTDSSILNSSPFAEGWVCMIEPSNWIKEIQLMDMADKYKKWIDAEFSRLKDFLATVLKPDSLQYSHVVLQDGGELIDGVLSNFGPQVWEDFQDNFLNSY